MIKEIACVRPDEFSVHDCLGIKESCIRVSYKFFKKHQDEIMMNDMVGEYFAFICLKRVFMSLCPYGCPWSIGSRN